MSLTPPPPTGGPLPPPPAAPAPMVAPARLLARRPGLPGGRAVVGALLVVTAGVGTFTVAGGDGDGPTGRYPVLRHAIDPGERLDGGDVDWRPMALDPDVADRTFTDAGDLTEAVALAPIDAGELLQRSDLARGDRTVAPTAVQLSIPVPVERTPPGLRRGERITLLATYGSGDGATTVRTVQSATVLAYETDADAIGAHDRGRLTLALEDPAAVIATAHAAQVAELTVVRTTGSDAALPERYRRDAPADDRQLP
jgi:hypothetical protein